MYVQRFPELEGRVPISVGGGARPTWSSDGREVVYLRSPSGPPDAAMRVRLEFDDGQPPSVKVGTPEQLFDWNYFGAPGGEWHFYGSGTRSNSSSYQFRTTLISARPVPASLLSSVITRNRCPSDETSWCRRPPGTTLGPYEILSPIGAGGMGEVYQGRIRR